MGITPSSRSSDRPTYLNSEGVMETSAAFSPCRKYRYALVREWDRSKPAVLFICLNPSTADENRNDPTIRRCIAFAKAWGYGKLVVCNLFAFRATDPKDMRAASDPVGHDNNTYLRVMHETCAITVAAWGCHGSYLGRDAEVSNLLGQVHHLERTKDGHPKHPLYLKSSLTPKL